MADADDIVKHIAHARLAVCEAPAAMLPADAGWQALAAQARRLASDIMLLNEMPFGPWIAAGPHRDSPTLRASHQCHDQGIARLGDLGAAVVLGTRPTFENEKSVNQAFVWDQATGLAPVHTKQFFPDEAGYYEARWFERGATHFRLTEVRGIRIGFLICTEVMFNEWARRMGRKGAQLIAVPRATPGSTVERWQTAMAMAAVVSGCYVASSNRVGRDAGGNEFGGRGWIIDPHGRLVVETSSEHPVVAADLDLALPSAMQREYPCYVEDLPRLPSEDS